MNSLRRHDRAVALVITLVILVIATILIVAFVTTMRTERRAAAAMANDERAKLVAQSALQHAIALLARNIPQPAPPGISGTAQEWIVNPGLLTLYSGPDSSGSAQYIPLSTNNNSSSPGTLPATDCANLNALALTSTNFPIIPTGDPVPASWVYVTQDPTVAASATNPIIGRYAFWMDDENNKININTAYGKPPAILNMVDGTSNFNYMVRSNPLDQSTITSSTANPTCNWFGTTTYRPEVGFNSLTSSSNVYSLTGTSTSYTVYTDFCPGGSSPSFPASGTEANAVGNPFLSGSYPGPRYYPIWHPSAVNLDILPASLANPSPIGATDLPSSGALNRRSLADSVFDAYLVSGVPAGLRNTGQWRLLQSPDQITQFITTGSAAAEAFYQANEFNLTAYNRAPEFNSFGKPRLLMEARIASTEENSSSTNPPDTCKGLLSGAELEFCQTPDLDPFGPTYFHGVENKAPYTGGTTNYYPDLTSVQMVGDYLSTLLARKDWPGMPPVSFVDKWGGGDKSPLGLLEADQVAWNIVAMGNYASNQEAENGATTIWPDDNYTVFTRNTGVASPDSAGNRSPYRASLSSQLDTAAAADPNLSLRLGKLSQKAIMPYSPKPCVNEVALVVDAVPVSSTTATTTNTFYLKLSLQVELYVPRRGPPGTFWPHNCLYSFVATHFFYTAAGTSGSGAPVTIRQGGSAYPSYGDEGASDGYPGLGGTNAQASGGSTTYPWAGCLWGSFPTPPDPPVPPAMSTVYAPVDTYPVCVTSPPSNVAGAAIYISSSPAFQYEPVQSGSSVIVPAKAQSFQGTVNIQAKLRLALFAHSSANTWDIVPVWDNVDTNLNALKPPVSPVKQSDSIAWNFTIDLTSCPSTGGNFIRSLEVADPRIGGNTNYNSGPSISGTIWQPHPNTSNPSYTAVANTLGAENAAALNSNPPLDLDSIGYFDFQGGGANGGFYKNSPRPSIGFLDCIPTGMQRSIVNSTLAFGPSADKTQLPDWLMLDLVAPTFADMNQPGYAPYSYRHSTMGKININSTIYPALKSPSGTTTTRNLPLEALFKNTVPDAALASGTGIVANIVNHTLSGQDFGAQGQYDYIGELCEVKGVADGTFTTGTSKWDKEALIRNLANLVTTQSNTFHLWGAAQSLKVVKGAANSNYGIYQPGDTITVTGEKRFESVIERGVWPGVDGVPGNGHISASGGYDEKSTNTISPLPVSLPWAAVPLSSSTASSAVVPPTSAQWAQFDGPDDPNAPRANAGYTPFPGWYGAASLPLQWTSTPIQNARNPARVYMTYKPVMFRYLSE